MYPAVRVDQTSIDSLSSIEVCSIDHYGVLSVRSKPQSNRTHLKATCRLWTLLLAHQRNPRDLALLTTTLNNGDPQPVVQASGLGVLSWREMG